MSELKVAAATLSEPEDVVVFGTSAALAVVTGYAPASGGDRGSVTTRIYGARVYVHEAATAGNIYCFNPRAFRVFSSRLRSASVIDPTTRWQQVRAVAALDSARGGRGRRRGRR
jgi:hypothetical protein